MEVCTMHREQMEMEAYAGADMVDSTTNIAHGYTYVTTKRTFRLLSLNYASVKCFDIT